MLLRTLISSPLGCTDLGAAPIMIESNSTPSDTGDSGHEEADSDADTDSDTDADTDADSDSDTDADSDSDTDADSDADSDADDNRVSWEEVSCEDNGFYFAAPSAWDSATSSCWYASETGGWMVNAESDDKDYAFENGWSQGVRCSNGVGLWFDDGDLDSEDAIYPSPVASDCWDYADDPVACTEAMDKAEVGGCNGYIE